MRIARCTRGFMKILVCEGNIKNAKSYPFWPQPLEALKQHEIKKIEGILEEHEIIDLVNWCDIWISIDSLLQHLAAFHKLKPGIVIWGKSDPEIFGYKHNINLLKDRKCLRPNQFAFWKDEPIDPEVFVAPEVILRAIEDMVQ